MADLHFHLLESHDHAKHGNGGFGTASAMDPVEFAPLIERRLREYYALNTDWEALIGQRARGDRTSPAPQRRNRIVFTVTVYPCTEECRAWEPMHATLKSPQTSSESSGDDSPTGQ